MIVSKALNRVDANEKVRGIAKYTKDLLPDDALVAKVLHSTIANGLVTKIDITEAEKVDGVVKIVTCFEVPDIQFPTAGHPWSTEKAHQDVSDRKLLNQRVRYYGDEIAAVIAENEIAAIRAIKLIKVEYDEYTPLLSIEAALAKDATSIHEEHPDNILAHSSYEIGDYEKARKEKGLIKVEDDYYVPMVKHCHMENAISFAYEEADKIVVVAGTQIPHIVRRVVSQALGKPMGQIRIIKPYIGGGFGDRQDALTEPLNAYLSLQVNGRPVLLEYTREENFVSTRVRHEMKFHIITYVRPDGTFVARSIVGYSGQGAYGSHAHALMANAINAFRMMYPYSAIKGEGYTVYTNLPTAGAMRAYGIPQIASALESHVDDIAKILKLDPIKVREKNMMRLGYVDPGTTITCHSTGLQECIDKGKEFIHWDEKIKEYSNEKGDIRRGVGMSIFCYKTGVYPIALETASCRMLLNQDGSIQLQMGATEIGQGADTVFSQMAAETLGFSFDRIHIISKQDTDVTPYDSGAYASRQTYVSGMVVKKTAISLKKKICSYAGHMLKLNPNNMDIEDNMIIDSRTKEPLIAVGKVAEEACYSREYSNHIAAEETNHCTDNTYSFGTCFVDISIDMQFCKIKVNKIINVHDSGIIINPQTAIQQVEGGMGMGLGYGLLEKLVFDPKTGRELNDNLLDYKMMTALDTPDLDVAFVETNDPTGPYGNKALGEPPLIPVAPALRNAVLNATGVGINSIPLNSEHLFNEFKKAGII